MRCNMNELGGLFANDMRTEEFLIDRRENKFDHSTQVADDLSTRIFFVISTPYEIGNILGFTIVLCQANGRKLRDRIDRQRQEWSEPFLILQLKCMHNSRPRLFH